MSFGAPIWLLGLVAWGVVAIYLMRGRWERVGVPYLNLWPREGIAPSSRRARRLPPRVAALLAAALLAIVAAGGPRAGHSGISRPVTLILDRGITMSVRRGTQRRFQTVAGNAADEILNILGPGMMRLVVVPGGDARIVDRSAWTDGLTYLDPTAADTQAALGAAAREALLDSQAIVIVLSDRRINVDDPRLVRITPQDQLTNIGIAALAVRAEPAPQAMVRLDNDSPLGRATLRVSGAAGPVAVDLPPRGGAKNYFVDLRTAGPEVEAAVRPGGNIEADDRAWVVRSQSSARLQVGCALPPEVQRMVEVYGKDRPPGEESATVPISANDSSGPAVQIAPADTPLPQGQVQLESSPITDGLDWSAVAGDGRIAVQRPDASWRAVASVTGQVLAAVREQPARQVWVGFRSAAWAGTPDFVLFWSKAFDWVGGGQDAYLSTTVGNEELWPGVYRRAGHRIAVNAPAVRLEAVTPEDWQNKLAGLAAEAPIGPADLSGWALVGAIACLLAAAVA
jgi:hypothetical protein